MFIREPLRHHFLLTTIALVFALASQIILASPKTKNPKRNGFEPQETLEELESRLNSDDPEIRASGSWALEALFSETVEARRMIPRLLELLDDDSSPVRQGSLGAIFNLGGPKAKAALPKLASMAKDKDAKVRGTLLLGLGKMKPADAQPGMAEAVRLLADPDEWVRSGARHALPLLPGKGLDAQTPFLVELVKTADPEVASVASIVLAASSRPEKSEALPRLIEFLRSDNELAQYHTAIALAGFGDSALPALPHLIRMTEGQSKKADKLMLGDLAIDVGPYGIRLEVIKAIAALAPLDPKSSLPVLEKQLAFETPGWVTAYEIRGAAAIAIAQIGSPTADSAVGPLIELLDDGYTQSSEPAVEALKKMNKDVLRKHMSRLIEMLARGYQSEGPDGIKRNQYAVQVIEHLKS